MPRRKKKAAMLAAQEETAHIKPPEPPPLPLPQRAFFDMLLEALGDGLHELGTIAKTPRGDNLPRKCSQLRATVSYAQALLRLEELPQAQGTPEELTAVLNAAVNKLRREFLYAGVAIHRPPDEPLRGVMVPGEATAFLLEEMISCCLRCAPMGKHLHLGARRIDHTLLLSMRTEGPARQQQPLIPPLDEDECEDYGFAMCRRIAAHAGWEFRWEADGAGVRMFLQFPQSAIRIVNYEL